MFRCAIYTIFRENFVLLAQNYAFYNVFYIGCVTEYTIHHFVDLKFFTKIKTIFSSLFSLLTTLKIFEILICNA